MPSGNTLDDAVVITSRRLPTLGEWLRSTAEQAVTAWRSLEDPLKYGAAASLLSLGHILLQLYSVGAGLDEARFVLRIFPQWTMLPVASFC